MNVSAKQLDELIDALKDSVNLSTTVVNDLSRKQDKLAESQIQFSKELVQSHSRLNEQMGKLIEISTRAEEREVNTKEGMLRLGKRQDKQEALMDEHARNLNTVKEQVIELSVLNKGLSGWKEGVNGLLLKVLGAVAIVGVMAWLGLK